MQKINTRRGGSDTNNNNLTTITSSNLSSSSPTVNHKNNNSNSRLRCSDRNTLQKLLKEELRLTIMAKRQARGEGEVRADSSEPQSYQLSSAEVERKERRREQNRRAAQRCRRKKRLNQLSVLQNYEWIITHNQQLQEEVDQLRQETSHLHSVLRAHRDACTCTGTGPHAHSNNNSTIKTDRAPQQMQLALPVAPKIKVEPCEDSPSSAAHGVVGYGGSSCNAGGAGAHPPVSRHSASSSCLYGSEKVAPGSEQSNISGSVSSVLQHPENTYTGLQHPGCPFPGLTPQTGFHTSPSPSVSSPSDVGNYPPHRHQHNHNNDIATTFNNSSNNNHCIKSILNSNSGNNLIQSQQQAGRLGKMASVAMQGEAAAAPGHPHHQQHHNNINHHHLQHHHQPNHHHNNTNNHGSYLANGGIAVSNGNGSGCFDSAAGFAPATSTPFASPPPQIGVVAPSPAPASMAMSHSNHVPQLSASSSLDSSSSTGSSNSHLTLLEEFAYIPGGGLRSCVFQEEAATPLSADGRRSISSVSSDLSTTASEHHHHHHQQQQQQQQQQRSHQHSADVAMREESDVIMSDYSTTSVNVTTHDDVSQLLSQINQNDLIFQQDGAAGMDDVFAASDAVAVSMASTLSEHFLQSI